MTTLQPHQTRKKFAVADRHAALGEAGRIVPVTNRLRIHELADDVAVDVRQRERRGTHERIDVGKATEPTPTAARRPTS
jgi:hypothetical protein